MSDANKEDSECDTKPPVNNRFPRIVVIIMLAEFCERLSYSGMRAGNLLVAITAIPPLGLPGRLCTIIGLLLITIGTGGIKPCVTAFGGDQFDLPRQEKHLAIYFSVLYFNSCTGALIAKTVSPILRSEVSCFGDKDCYSLAFGAPGLVVLCSIVIFVSAKSRYIMKKPEGNVVVDFIKCVTLGLKNLVLRRKKDKNSHWLDTTQHQYDKRFIRDIKKTLSILMLFTVLPVFWALLDQMGSRWTLQATKMNGKLGFLTVKPDQLQVMAPIFILILIPISQKYVYPFCEKRNILVNPLHKLTLGGILAGLAFIVSGLVEIYLKTTYPQLPTVGLAQLRIFNGNPCNVAIHNDNITYTIPAHSHYVKKDFRVHGRDNIAFELSGGCITPRNEVFPLAEERANSYFLDGDEVHGFFDNLDKSKSGLPVVRFLVTRRINATDIKFYNEKRSEIETYINVGVSSQIEVFSSSYSVWVDDEMVMSDVVMSGGGVFTVLIDKVGDEYKSEVMVMTAPNSITMAWLLPQFLIISIAEVLFGVTGNEFAFKEAPDSMKAVMTAIWLLTEAVGNIIIIIVTRIFVNYKQETQFFVYTGLMFSSILLFHFMARGYHFGPLEEEELPQKKCRSNSEVLYLQVKQAEDLLDH
ncbi:hypothetical protein MSG28_005351 [Choristoneura fumiferana]|uniref:Uncharacterized protein n=1 Tax=Choristoneura fumiferana TaxID=7141 RepID=A0ACC0JR71_CHOFU|nr:hypothetical protein MSG28_005351 [Choristoneura fumiferana]